MMQNNVEKDPAWEWAGDGNSKKFLESWTQVKRAVDNNDFCKTVIFTELTVLKKSVEQSEFDKQCKAFSLALDHVVAALAKETRLLVKQQVARLSES